MPASSSGRSKSVQLAGEVPAQLAGRGAERRAGRVAGRPKVSPGPAGAAARPCTGRSAARRRRPGSAGRPGCPIVTCGRGPRRRFPCCRGPRCGGHGWSFPGPPGPGSSVDGVVAGGPQVLHRVGPPRPPGRGALGQRRPGVAGRPSSRAASRTPRSVAGTRPGRRGRASRSSRRVHGPKPGSARQPRAGPRAQSLPGLEVDPPARQRPGQRRERRAPGPRAGPAWPGPARPAPPGRETGGSGRRPGRRPARRARRASRPAWVRAAAVETCWPSTARTANSAGVDGAGHPPSGRLVDQRGEHRVLAQQVVHGDRVGVQVEQPPAPADRGGQVAQVGQGQLAGDVVRPAAAAPRRPCPCGSRRVRR